jgi:hypothetical protein
MIKSIFSSIGKSLKERNQLIFENIFLAKQLEIYQRDDPKLKTKKPGNPFLNYLKNIFSNKGKEIIKLKQQPLLKKSRKVVKSSKGLKRK